MITFMQASPTHIDIFLNGKQVGHIFSPSGSGQNCLNAIQVCGFDEAFDLWGCGLFAEAEEKVVPYSDEQKERISKMGLEPKEHRIERNIIHKKDIQLLFTDYKAVERREAAHTTHSCFACYNEPCTCDRKEPSDRVPYKVKRESDVADKLLYASKGIAEMNKQLQENQ